MKLTESQRVAIEHRGSNLLVAASAGAGKTEVLARRCLALIADAQQPCGVERLLVVTFTRAAAAELRVRVGRMLREEAEHTRPADLRRHLRRQEALVGAADIGTIDAWCGRIVREHFAEAGVDVAFTVLGEQDARLLRREVLDALFDQFHRGGEPLAEEARAWLARTTAPDDGFLRTLVADLNAFREHLVNPEDWFERQRGASAANDAERLLAAALAEECRFQHEQLERLLAGALTGAAPRVLRPYADKLSIWHRTLPTPGALAGVTEDIAAFKLAKPPRGTAEAPEVAEVRQRWLKERLQKAWSPDAVASILEHAADTAGLVAVLLRLEERYQQMLAEAKRQRAAYEFADVLRMALDLLGTPTGAAQRTPTDVARRLQRRYEHVLVDEYQDTSPVQVEILRLVTRDDPGQTNRFMVGDVKQSIYGFRQAEPRLFTALADAFEGGQAEGRVTYLSDNFRSHGGLLEALNELFARLFDRALGGTAYGEKERLRAGRAEGELANPTLDAGPRTEIHVIEQDRRRVRATDEDEPDAQDVERIEREAQLAADQINALLRTGVQVPQRGSDERTVLRPLRLADIVILLRSAVQQAGQVARVLRANGLHCVTSGRETMLDVIEVRDICNVLQLLVNRRQDVPLAAYLRSPLVGLSETELLHVRTAFDQRDTDFYAAVEHFRSARPVASLAVKLDAAMAQLDGWMLVAREEELPALLRRMFQDSGVSLLAGALKDGEQRVALLRSLQNLATAVAGAGPAGVADFVEYIEKLSAEEIDPGALAAGDEDVVRIMTIHGAKGLEFPIVFLLGAGAQFNTLRQRQTTQCDADVGVGLRFADYRARAMLVSARHHILQRRVAQRELEEELRLLYVAATRARERLFVVGHAKPGMWDDCCTQYRGRSELPLISRLSVHNRLEWVLMAAAATNDPSLLHVQTHTPAEIRVVEGGDSNVTAPPVPELTAEDAAWLQRGRQWLAADVGSVLADFPATLSVSAVKELALRERTEDRPHMLDRVHEALPVPLFAAEGGATDGRELGTACHRFLEWADLQELAAVEQVQAQAAQLVTAGRLSAKEAALVPAADVAWFGTTPEGRLLAEHAEAARREVPFVYALPLGESGERTIVRGVMDCLLDTPAGLTIVDYKTDTVRDERDFEERLAGYRVQLQLYAQAASAAFARPVTQALVVFLRARRVINVPLTSPVLSELLADRARET